MPNLVDKNHCCGCAACANKCGRNAISMRPDEEGFLHPVIDKALCIECGLCEKVCPGLNPAVNNDVKPHAFVVQNTNDHVRYESTSGGAFTAIAEEIIDRGGVVFGAMMTNQLIVKHGFVDTKEGLSSFRNSKYVQSEIGDSYKQAKVFLRDGRIVCFSGTPCQINGLYKYLGMDYENLFAVDVCCKSVPSPLIFQKYKEYKASICNRPVSDIVFRDKKRGFSYCTMAHYEKHEDRLKGNSFYRRGSESDEFLRLFLNGSISRMSCYTCPYQISTRVGDFTLWDRWDTLDVVPEWNDNKGTTNVMVWTEKALALFSQIGSKIRCREFPKEKAGGAMGKIRSLIVPDIRFVIFKDANIMQPKDFFNKYAPVTLKISLYHYIRYAIWKLHLHNVIRLVYHFFYHRFFQKK